MNFEEGRGKQKNNMSRNQSFFNVVLLAAVLLCLFFSAQPRATTVRDQIVVADKTESVALHVPPTVLRNASLCRRKPRPSHFTLNSEMPPLVQLQRGMKPKYYSTGYYGWKFQRYVPSAFESEWLEEMKKRETNESVEVVIESTATRMKERFEKLLTILSKYATKRVFPHRHTLLDQCNDPANDTCGWVPDDLDEDVMSRFDYKYGCWDGPCDGQEPQEPNGKERRGFIEPLVGHLRHPGFTTKKDDNYMPHRDFLIVDKWSMQNVGRPPEPCDGTRSAVFDLGASAFLPAFYSSQWYLDVIASCLCTPMTDYYGWEAKRHAIPFLHVPGSLYPKYRFYNFPITAIEDSWKNPLNTLLSEHHEQDTIMFKLDIDAPLIEEAVVKLILEVPEVSRLIDEFFFEHHVNMGRMVKSWGPSDTPPSVSIKVFQDLRYLGIRAHSWI